MQHAWTCTSNKCVMLVEMLHVCRCDLGYALNPAASDLTAKCTLPADPTAAAEWTVTGNCVKGEFGCDTTERG
jgi:hypothetical protein